MTEHEALIKIQELINSHYGGDPAYYTNSEKPEEADTTRLCCQINELVNSVEKKLYGICYEQFFFGRQYNCFIKIVKTCDIFHEVGELIYHASTAVKNIRWWELQDKTRSAAMIRFEKDGQWKAVEHNLLRRIEKQ